MNKLFTMSAFIILALASCGKKNDGNPASNLPPNTISVDSKTYPIDYIVVTNGQFLASNNSSGNQITFYFPDGKYPKVNTTYKLDLKIKSPEYIAFNALANGTQVFCETNETYCVNVTVAQNGKLHIEMPENIAAAFGSTTTHRFAVNVIEP